MEDNSGCKFAVVGLLAALPETGLRDEVILPDAEEGSMKSVFFSKPA